MKRTILTSALLLSAAVLGAQNTGSSAVLSYSLPRTVLNFNVTATQSIFHAGPYAKYAQKYLGIEAGSEDKSTFVITEVSLKTANEADQSRRYSVTLNESTRASYLQMTSQGLISTTPEKGSAGSAWAFTPESYQDFATKGIPANLTTTKSTLYDKAGGAIVQKSLVVEKSLEDKAKEVAEMIFKIRENKYKILIGDTDATYSGEAMKATIDELSKMEKDYLTLFTGYSESCTHQASFEIVPDAAAPKQIYIAFRVSDSEGLLPADNVAGSPYFVELVPESIADAPAVEITDKKMKLEQTIVYRIPAVCTVRLSDGSNTILNSRIPVYQLGSDEEYPIYTKK